MLIDNPTVSNIVSTIADFCLKNVKDFLIFIPEYACTDIDQLVQALNQIDIRFCGGFGITNGI